jgi:hypothetical protein
MPVTGIPRRVVIGILIALSLGSRHAGAEEPAPEPPAEAAPPAVGEDVVACVRAAEDAQSLRSAHRLRASFKRLLVCAQSNCPAVVRNDCVFWLAEVEKMLPSVIVHAEDKDGGDLTDVSVSMDGQPLVSRLDGLSVPVDPGMRAFRFEHVGSTPVEKRILIREGEKGRRISIVFDPRPPALPPKPPAVERRARVPVASIVFGGVGAGALGSFAYFGLTGTRDAADLGDGCGRDKTCREDQVAPIRRKLLIADISLAVGLVSLGAAAYVFFTRSEPKAPPAVSADVVVGKQGTQVALRAPF